MASIWHPYGIHMAPIWQSIWHPCGIHIDAIWHPYGIHMASIWHPYGINIDAVWHPYGIHMASIWQPYGNHMATIWQPYGNVMDNFFLQCWCPIAPRSPQHENSYGLQTYWNLLRISIQMNPDMFQNSKNSNFFETCEKTINPIASIMIL